MAYYYELAIPYRILLSSEDMKKYYEIINRYNGYRSIHRTIYNFRSRNEKTANYKDVILDRMEFDFDDCPDSSPYQEARRLHDFLWEQGEEHTILSTSKGRFHVMIYTTESKAQAGQAK